MTRTIEMRNITESLRESGVRPEKPGDFWWSNIDWKKDGSENAGLYVAVPLRETLGAAYEIYWVPVSTTGGADKDDRWWNGDWDKPTVKGSWGIEHFYFTITDGVMVEHA